VLFGYSIVWPLVTEWIVQSCKQGHAEKRKMKFIKGNVTGTVNLVTHCSVQLNVQVLWNSTRSI
jgi:hypothetical protein